MITLIKIMVFLAGMCASIQVLAAFYRIFDLWYTMHTASLKVIRGILGWLGFSIIIALLLGERWRGAFLWGLVFYIPFYVINFFLLQAVLKYRCRSKETQ